MLARCDPNMTVFATKVVRPPAIGGTAMALSKVDIIIGSEGGGVLRYSWNKLMKNVVMSSNITTHWDKGASTFLDKLPAYAQTKLRKYVETWANDKRKRVITIEDIFQSKPQVEHVFPSQIDRLTNYHQAHVTYRVRPITTGLFLFI